MEKKNLMRTEQGSCHKRVQGDLTPLHTSGPAGWWALHARWRTQWRKGARTTWNTQQGGSRPLTSVHRGHQWGRWCRLAGAFLSWCASGTPSLFVQKWGKWIPGWRRFQRDVSCREKGSILNTPIQGNAKQESQSSVTILFALVIVSIFRKCFNPGQNYQATNWLPRRTSWGMTKTKNKLKNLQVFHESRNAYLLILLNTSTPFNF